MSVSTLPPAPATVDRFACPRCRRPLDADGDDALACSAHGSALVRRDGIWRCLPEPADPRQHAFVAHYRRVRRQEGWGRAGDAAWYRALPQVPASDPHAAVWRVRAASFRALERRVVTPLVRARGLPLRIADLGAGNGWLAHRLALAGHQVAAVDLDDDPVDGLGAAAYYATPPPFLSVQADFAHLPWADGSFDLAIFDGALHYAEDVARPLAEALRVLGPDGRVAILDSPFYRREASGEQMVAQRDRDFATRLGSASPIRHEGFLTRARMAAVGRELGVAWRWRRPWYGFGWALRPLKNRLLGVREPARFYLAVGRRS